MTATRQIAQGRWNEIKGKLKETWGQLTDDELDRVKGDSDQLIGLVQRKTGKSRAAIEDFLDNLSGEGQSIWATATQTVREYAGTAGQAIQERAQAVQEQVQSGIEHTGEMVRNRPLESVAVCFGIGMVVGVITGMMMRR
jgi:uncharacterized protein YjbJ (UPF0337 family)